MAREGCEERAREEEAGRGRRTRRRSSREGSRVTARGGLPCSAGLLVLLGRAHARKERGRRRRSSRWGLQAVGIRKPQTPRECGCPPASLQNAAIVAAPAGAAIVAPPSAFCRCTGDAASPGDGLKGLRRDQRHRCQPHRMFSLPMYMLY
jgi:hypothetical protein